MSEPKLRMIAGPNGSGKSTLYNYLKNNFNFHFGEYVNADVLEKQMRQDGFFKFSAVNLVDNKEQFVKSFFESHPLNTEKLENAFSVKANKLYINAEKANGYFAAILADYIRQQLLSERRSFTFETVMSSRDKVDLLKKALSKGYRTYLYFICTEDVIINKNRIAIRVQQGEHDVPEERIISRYERSLNLLSEAIENSSRAYVFDNSSNYHELIAEITAGSKVHLYADNIPYWFNDYFLDKK